MRMYGRLFLSVGNTSACLSKNPHHNPLPLVKGEASSVCMLTYKYGLISRESRTRGYGEGKEGTILTYSRLAPVTGRILATLLPPLPARGERTQVRGVG
jgi:hypothetical protein